MKIQKKVINDPLKVIISEKLDQKEIDARKEDLEQISLVNYAKKHSSSPYTPIELIINNKKHLIQTNHCSNPFCEWFGLSQLKYDDIKNKPSRYRIDGKIDSKKIKCNAIENHKIETMDRSLIISNHSLASEIKRLIDLDTLEPMKSNYNFHKDECINKELNPIDNPKSFLMRGKSTSHSQIYQCKECKKYTNVLPDQDECFSYHQQKNDILVRLFEEIVGKSPVKRTMEKLKIGSSTYYRKLEWIYERCLVFLERHETNFNDIHFNNIWLETDVFKYYLNNIRKKGHGGDISTKEELRMPIEIVDTIEKFSHYILRSDLAYDFYMNVEKFKEMLDRYCEYNLYPYSRYTTKYMIPKIRGEKKERQVLFGEKEFNRLLKIREQYADGFQIKYSYTAYAQYWLIRDMLNYDNLNIISDKDNGLIQMMKKAFVDDIKENKVNIFTCKVDKDLSRKEAYGEYMERRKYISEYCNSCNLTIKEAAIDIIGYNLKATNILYSKKRIDDYEVKTNGNDLDHPTPFIDEGIRYVNCLTDISKRSISEQAALLYRVDSRAINTFFNQIRRHVNIFERPLATARGDKRSYIYANVNPLYAHYTMTILKTYLNYVYPIKYYNKKEKMTPAMKIGLVDKIYEIKDILYIK